MKNYKFTPQVKMRMVLILLFGSVVVALIFAFGFFAMQNEFWNSTKQCRASIDQISQTMTSLRHK